MCMRTSVCSSGVLLVELFCCLLLSKNPEGVGAPLVLGTTEGRGECVCVYGGGGGGGGREGGGGVGGWGGSAGVAGP